DVDFVIKATETFDVSQGGVVCRVSGELDADIGWLNYFVGLLTNPWGILFTARTGGAHLDALFVGSLVASAIGVVPTVRTLPTNVKEKFDLQLAELFWRQFEFAGATVQATYSRVGLRFLS